MSVEFMLVQIVTLASVNATLVELILIRLQFESIENDQSQRFYIEAGEYNKRTTKEHTNTHKNINNNNNLPPTYITLRNNIIKNKPATANSNIKWKSVILFF